MMERKLARDDLLCVSSTDVRDFGPRGGERLRRSSRRFAAVLAALVVLVGLLAVGSDAGHQTSVTSYTGCLKQGALTRVEVGDSPTSPCPSGHVEVHLSGGDLTGVVAGSGLAGGASQGEATLSVDFTALGQCPGGSAIRVIEPIATCEIDDDTTYAAGAGLDLNGNVFGVDTLEVQARVGGTCVVGSAIRAINADGTVVCEAIPPGGLSGGELILIQRHEFDTSENFDLGPSNPEWEIIVTGGADVFLDPDQPPYITSALTMDTQSAPFDPGSVVVRGTRQASASGGTLVFKTRILDAYAEGSGAVYGNRQPRGLAFGTDRDNAIEFVNAGGPGATLVTCRTVSGGAATETTVDIGQWVRHPAVYQIVVTPTEAKFYVNGVLRCTHTTNIPPTPLNAYFATSDGGAGNVPMIVDWVSFERRQG